MIPLGLGSPLCRWSDTTSCHIARQRRRTKFQGRSIDPVAQLASLVAPPLCGACGAVRPGDGVLCERCATELASAPRVVESGPAHLDLVISASPFEGATRRIVHGLKFGRRLSLAGVAAEAMLRVLPAGESFRGVVPVPPGPLRWRWRGFGSAEGSATAGPPPPGLPP